MKFKGIRRDTLDIPNNQIEVVWGVEFEVDEKEPEVQRALRAGTIEERAEEAVSKRSKKG